MHYCPRTGEFKIIMKSKLLILFVMSIFSMFGSPCASGKRGGNNEHIKSVDTSVFATDIRQPGITLLDVRTPEEYAEGHIKGAVNINLFDEAFKEKVLKELPKDKTVFVYCRSGRRSMSAAEILAAEGYKVVNLEDGIIGWQRAGLPVE